MGQPVNIRSFKLYFKIIWNNSWNFSNKYSYINNILEDISIEKFILFFLTKYSFNQYFFSHIRIEKIFNKYFFDIFIFDNLAVANFNNSLNRTKITYKKTFINRLFRKNLFKGDKINNLDIILKKSLRFKSKYLKKRYLKKLKKIFKNLILIENKEKNLNLLFNPKNNLFSKNKLLTYMTFSTNYFKDNFFDLKYKNLSFIYIKNIEKYLNENLWLTKEKSFRNKLINLSENNIVQKSSDLKMKYKEFNLNNIYLKKLKKKNNKIKNNKKVFKNLLKKKNLIINININKIYNIYNNVYFDLKLKKKNNFFFLNLNYLYKKVYLNNYFFFRKILKKKYLYIKYFFNTNLLLNYVLIKNKINKILFYKKIKGYFNIFLNILKSNIKNYILKIKNIIYYNNCKNLNFKNILNLDYFIYDKTNYANIFIDSDYSLYLSKNIDFNKPIFKNYFRSSFQDKFFKERIYLNQFINKEITQYPILFLEDILEEKKIKIKNKLISKYIGLFKNTFKNLILKNYLEKNILFNYFNNKLFKLKNLIYKLKKYNLFFFKFKNLLKNKKIILNLNNKIKSRIKIFIKKLKKKNKNNLKFYNLKFIKKNKFFVKNPLIFYKKFIYINLLKRKINVYFFSFIKKFIIKNLYNSFYNYFFSDYIKLKKNYKIQRGLDFIIKEGSKKIKNKDNNILNTFIVFKFLSKNYRQNYKNYNFFEKLIKYIKKVNGLFFRQNIKKNNLMDICFFIYYSTNVVYLFKIFFFSLVLFNLINKIIRLKHIFFINFFLLREPTPEVLSLYFKNVYFAGSSMKPFFKKISQTISRNFTNISGILFKLKGRFTRAQRATKFTYIHGNVPLNDFNSLILYHQRSRVFRTGIGSIKVWVYYQNKLNFYKINLYNKSNINVA